MNRIKELRLKKGISQRQLAKEIGISEQSISKYEHNKRNPKIDKLQKLANYFGVSVSYLQGVNEIPNDLVFSTKQEAIAFIHEIMKAQNIKLEDIISKSK